MRPIAEVQAKAESGDYVVVEGQITDTEPGMGNLVIGRIEDDTGWGIHVQKVEPIDR